MLKDGLSRASGALAAAAQRLGDARPHRGARLPPGPAEPAILQTLQWVRSPLEFLDRGRARFGRVFTTRLFGFPPLVHFSDPDAIREIFTGPSEALHAGEANAVLEPVLGARSLLLLDGEPHLRQRRLLLPPFHGQRMHAYGAVMREITERAVASFPRDTPFPVHARTQALALDVILETVFGVRGEADRRDLHRELTELFDAAMESPLFLLPAAQIDLGPLTSWGRISGRIRAVDRRLFDLIRARSRGRDGSAPAGATSDDVLALLIDARDEDGQPMTPAELRDELMTLLVAGHDTVATALAWTFHFLVENPGALERAYREVDERWTAASTDPARTPEMPWIDAIVKESLRLAPVLPVVARRLQTGMRIGGVDLPPGVRAAPNVYLTHTDPRNFPRPRSFEPERFLEGRPSQYAYFPFGGGGRRCIGMAFALYEMRVVLATVLSRLSIRRAPGPPVRAIRHGVAIAPSRGMPIIVSDRAR